jgi:hypothetical protein
LAKGFTKKITIAREKGCSYCRVGSREKGSLRQITHSMTLSYIGYPVRRINLYIFSYLDTNLIFNYHGDVAPRR